MSLAPAYAAAYAQGAFGELAERYLHRAVVEDSLGVIVGRDAIVAEAIRTASAFEDISATLLHDGEALGVIEMSGTIDGRAVRLREHRWSRFEGQRVAEDLLVVDRGALDLDFSMLGDAHPMQPPLGELRSGEGQFWAGSTAGFGGAVFGGAGFGGAGSDVADALHRIWNARQLDTIARLYAPDARWSGPGGRSGGPEAMRAWLTGLLARLPDATLMFDRSEVAGDRVAFLWRLFGHAGGRRARLIGSSLLTLHNGHIVADDTLIDEAALAATPHRPLLAL